MKRILVIAAFIITMNPLWAQVKVGVKAGGLLSNVTGQGIGLSSSGFISDPKLSYLIGGAVSIPLHPKISLQAELLYSNQGYRSVIPIDSLQEETTLHNYHYLSLPLTVQYRITERLHVGIGPEFGSLLGAYQRSRSFDPIEVGDRFYNTLDLSINLDAQYQVLDNLSLGLRYHLGVYDITKRYEVSTFDGEQYVIDDDVYNRSVQLSLTYWFR